MRSTLARTSASGVPASAVTASGAPETPVGARNSPKTSRRAQAHSPVVTPARAHSRVAANRLVSPAAAFFSSESASCARPSSRLSRQACSARTTFASLSGSTVMMAVSRSAVSGFGSVDS
ncbi:hypothetical protein SRIMM317S_00576 [Streptomyces rimosus subsp. rimosus]